MRNIIRIILWNYIIKAIIRYIIGITYADNRIIKETKQFIIVANHNSHLDTATILSALPAGALKKTHPVAAADYFGKNKFTTFLSEFFINALLIKRKKGQGGENPIKKMDSLLKEGKSLILFPEGSRGKPEELQKFKIGIAILLEKNPEIPYIPVYLNGMGKALPKGDSLLVPFTGSIVFGKPQFKAENITPEELAMSIEEDVFNLSELQPQG